MSFLYRLNRKIRRAVYSRMGEKALNIKVLQYLLGYIKRGDIIIEDFANVKLEYNFNNDIGKNLFYLGSFEEEEIRFFSDKLMTERNPLVIDIGANIGLHSLRWGKLRPECKIYAFEPSPGTRGVLERNIRRNFLSDNVFVIPQAVSDRGGCATFYQCEDNAYSSLKDTKRKTVINTIEVPVTTIDEFIEKNHIDNVSLIKIDVEGFEREVICGAEKTLKILKPDLFVEIYGGESSNDDPVGTVDYICSFGYKPYIIIEGKPIPYTSHNDYYYNYYFTFK